MFSTSVVAAAQVRPDCVPPPAAVSALVREAVLLVEDDEMVAMLLRQVLGRQGYRVLHASDGAECLRLLAENHDSIRLAVLDCGLPDTHGGALCRKIRAVVPALPTLLSSGGQQPGLLELLAADGPTAFLRKPFLAREMVQQVSELLNAAAHRAA